MIVFYVEFRSMDGSRSLSWDLAHHIFTRYLSGPIVVVTDKPLAFLSSVSKQWYHVIRQMHHERASTLHSDRIYQLSHAGRDMLELPMRLKTGGNKPPHHNLHGVTFTSTSEALEEPPICRTLYITSSATDSQFQQMTQLMPRHTLVVRYEFVYQ